MTDKGLVRCKYLDELNIPTTEYGTNFCDNTDKRWGKWMEEREIYGFDSRETWNIDQLLIEWIYIHFKMFKERANIEHDYNKVKFNDEEITQEQAIDIILAECERFILSNDIDSVFDKKVWKLIGKILPAMW